MVLLQGDWEGSWTDLRSVGAAGLRGEADVGRPASPSRDPVSGVPGLGSSASTVARRCSRWCGDFSRADAACWSCWYACSLFDVCVITRASVIPFLSSTYHTDDGFAAVSRFFGVMDAWALGQTLLHAYGAAALRGVADWFSLVFLSVPRVFPAVRLPRRWRPTSSPGRSRPSRAAASSSFCSRPSPASSSSTPCPWTCTRGEVPGRASGVACWVHRLVPVLI